MPAIPAIVVAVFLTQFLLGAAASAECPGDAAVFYLNGVNNTVFQAESSAVQLAKAIQKELDPSCPMPQVTSAYNATAGRIRDLTEAFVQIRDGVDDNDPDLLTHLGQYRDAINAGKKVVVVAHSQGNFYANKEYEKLALVPILPIDQHFAIVSVATPAGFVAGNGPYVTLFEDLFAVSFLFAKVPNTSNVRICGYSLVCHSFLGAYLSGRVSGPRIIGHILAAFPPPTAEPIVDQSAIDCFDCWAGEAVEFDQGLAQTFTVGVAGLLSQVDVGLYRFPGATTDLVLDILPASSLSVMSCAQIPCSDADLSGASMFHTQVPVATVPECLATLTSPVTPCSVALVSVDVRSAGIFVSPGQEFAIVLRRPGGASFPLSVIWQLDGGYARGVPWASNPFGSTPSHAWFRDPVASLRFRTWVRP